MSAFGSESAGPGTTVWLVATEVTAGNLLGIGKVTGASFGPAAAAPDGVGLAGAAEAGLAAADDFPLPLPGDGDFGLVGGEVARRAPEVGGGVAPEADLPEPDDSDRDFSGRSGPSAADFTVAFDEAPRASAAVRSEDLSLPSGVSPFLLSDFGLGSTLSRTTVSG